jgi:hypothetical protein
MKNETHSGDGLPRTPCSASSELPTNAEITMKLYKVRITFETVIRAESPGDAADKAERVIRDNDDPHSEIESDEIRSMDDLPEGWDAKCRPWGERDPYDRTIGEILGQNDQSPSAPK